LKLKALRQGQPTAAMLMTASPCACPGRLVRSTRTRVCRHLGPDVIENEHSFSVGEDEAHGNRLPGSPVMPKVSEEHLDARRRQIVDAAIACFVRDGFHRGTMQDICREAELSPGAIYRYFSSKDDLIEAIADDRHAREAGFMKLAHEVGGGIEGLRAFGRLSFKSLDDPDERRRRKLGVQVWAEAVRNPTIRNIIMRGIDRSREVTALLIREAQERGELPPALDPDSMARVMLALFQGFILQQAWDERVDVAAYFEAVEAVVDALTDQVAR
jgi:AcrR family transcriptional regulator